MVGNGSKEYPFIADTLIGLAALLHELTNWNRNDLWDCTRSIPVWNSSYVYFRYDKQEFRVEKVEKGSVVGEKW